MIDADVDDADTYSRDAEKIRKRILLFCNVVHVQLLQRYSRAGVYRVDLSQTLISEKKKLYRGLKDSDGVYRREWCARGGSGKLPAS